LDVDSKNDVVSAGAAGIAATKAAMRKRIGSLFLTADEGENGEFFWVVYMAGVKCFGSTSEEEADAFRAKLCQEVIRRLGL
jgi:hypothetical protein